jgi:hypothetical protein
MATTADTTNSQNATTFGIPQPPGTTTDTTSGIITTLSNTISLFSTTTPGNTISDISSSIYTTTQATDCMTSVNNSTTTQCPLNIYDETKTAFIIYGRNILSLVSLTQITTIDSNREYDRNRY